MNKRARESLTGGTGDVNPQWFVTAPLTIAAGYVEAGTTLPRERLPYGNKSQVMEILKLCPCTSPAVGFTQTAATNAGARLYLTTSSFGVTEPAVTNFGGKIVFQRRYDVSATAAAPATSFQVNDFFNTIDLTDGAGHGMLVATDQIFTGFIQSAGAIPLTAGTIAWRVYYRWKNVTLQEYIGIVQSQQ